MTPSLRFLPAAISTAFLAGLPVAAEVFAPSSDTSIAEEAPNATHYGAGDTLHTIGVPGFRACGFLRFHPESPAGPDVVGTVTLGRCLGGHYPENAAGRTVPIWALTQDGSGSTTWNGFETRPYLDLRSVPETGTGATAAAVGLALPARPACRRWTASRRAS